MNSDNNAIQDELQQAINSIANLDGGENNDAVVELENSLNKDDTSIENNNILGDAPAPEVPDMPAAPEAPKFEISGFNSSAAEEKKEESTSSMETTQPLNIQPGRAMYGDPDIDNVKISALTDLRPILEKVEGIDPERKFSVYKDIIELTDDKSCLEPTYQAAAKIEDETKRAEALLYIIEVIDRLGIKTTEK